MAEKTVWHWVCQKVYQRVYKWAEKWESWRVFPQAYHWVYLRAGHWVFARDVHWAAHWASLKGQRRADEWAERKDVLKEHQRDAQRAVS